MLKKKVRVQIEGRNYSLITTEDSKYVQQITDQVIAHIRKTATGPTQLDTRDCAILAALDFCDEKIKAESRSQEVVKKADQIIQQTNELNKMCSEYKEKLTEAINENTRLSKRIKALEEQLGTLAKENENLKKKQPNQEIKPEPVKKTAEEKRKEKLMGYVPMTQYSLFDDDNNE